MTPFKLTIPEPCHENWNEMNPKEKGRFCGVCDKTVVDFTNKSPIEISTYLQNSTGKVCGRFKSDVINKVHVPIQTSTATGKIRSKWFARLKAFAFLGPIAIGLGKKAEACPTPNSPLYNGENPNLIQAKKGHTIIKGEIKNTNLKTGIAEVEIKVYSGGKIIAISKSFVNGSYFINIQENTIFDFKIDVEYNAVNYISQILHDLPVQKEEIALNVELVEVEEIMTMGDVSYNIQEVEVVEKQVYHTMGAMVMTRYTIPDVLVKEEIIKAKEDTIVVEFINPQEFQINAYPNPTANIVTVDILNTTQASIQLFDLNGRMIQSITSREAKNILDLSNEPNGTYIVRVIDDATNKSIQKKIIKVY